MVGGSDPGTGASASTIAVAVLDAARSSHVTAGSIGEFFQEMMDQAIQSGHAADSVLDVLRMMLREAIDGAPAAGSIFEKLRGATDNQAFASAGLISIPDVLYDSIYFIANPISSATADTFGAYVELIANAGTGKKILGVLLVHQGSIGGSNPLVEIEIATGAAASEVAVCRFAFPSTSSNEYPQHNVLLNRTIADNSRVSVRCRDIEAVANNFAMVAVMIGTA